MMEVYTLTIYFIHGKCASIMLSHHLQLKVLCDFTYATNGIFNYKLDCNCLLVINCTHKLTFFISACIQRIITIVKFKGET